MNNPDINLICKWGDTSIIHKPYNDKSISNNLSKSDMEKLIFGKKQKKRKGGRGAGN